LCEKKGTNYFVDDGVCDQLPMAAHPSESIRTLRNNLQPAHPYLFKMITPEEDAEMDEATKNDPEYIYAAENIIAASDSFVDPVSGEATCNWRITTYKRRGLITKSSFVNGNPLYMNSYRGEMAGIQDLADWLHKTDLRNKVIKIVCDNESCVTGLQNRNMSLTDLDKAESDLMQDIIQKLKNFPDVTIKWVQGHQDDNTHYDDLPIESQLNVDCDKAAKFHLKEGTKLNQNEKPLAGSKATLYLGRHMVTTEINAHIKWQAGQKKSLPMLRINLDGLTIKQLPLLTGGQLRELRNVLTSRHQSAPPSLCMDG
jgi:ribonuclease HI